MSENAKFVMKVNHVKVVDELLQMKNKVNVEGKEVLFCELVEKVIKRNRRPYFSDEKEDFAKEQYDRNYKGNIEKWGR